MTLPLPLQDLVALVLAIAAVAFLAYALVFPERF